MTIKNEPAPTTRTIIIIITGNGMPCHNNNLYNISLSQTPTARLIAIIRQ